MGNHTKGTYCRISNYYLCSYIVHSCPHMPQKLKLSYKKHLTTAIPSDQSSCSASTQTDPVPTCDAVIQTGIDTASDNNLLTQCITVLLYK